MNGKAKEKKVDLEWICIIYAAGKKILAEDTKGEDVQKKMSEDRLAIGNIGHYICGGSWEDCRHGSYSWHDVMCAVWKDRL